MSLFQTRVQFSPGMQSDSSHSDRTRPTWSPYDNNGGTTLAVAGEDYCIVAASVRLATGFSILSRDSTRIKILNQRCVMSSSGFQADYQTLQKLLGARQVGAASATFSPAPMFPFPIPPAPPHGKTHLRGTSARGSVSEEPRWGSAGRQRESSLYKSRIGFLA
uniref:Proteasome subunit beta type-1 n=1 Tax=Tetraselmis sp. GSL018 TaxID=582737 RepID=A0A061RYF4_9CHLO